MTLNAKIGFFMDFFTLSDCETYFKSELCRNHCWAVICESGCR